MVSRSVLVVGAGLVGTRRAQLAARHPDSRLVAACDADADRARAVGAECGGAAFTDWRVALAEVRPDIAIVCTPHRWLAPVATAAMQAGAAVLVEKPFGRSLDEARQMAQVAAATGATLGIGFNHRFHPAIAAAAARIHDGGLGPLQFARAVYGHGGRPGYQHEWRCNPDAAGGGELLDQGVHLVDLLCWLLGRPVRVQGEIATLDLPTAVEDNAFALLRFDSGAVASLHASWSQWQNRFALEIYGRDGAVEVHGLGGSYGLETLRLLHRRPGAAPAVEEATFPDDDPSWSLEWDAFLQRLEGRGAGIASPDEGLVVMATIDAIYRAAGRVTSASPAPR